MVINPLDNAEPQITAAEAVGTKVDSTTCELYGIVLGLQTAIQYCRFNTNSNFPERLLCDSLQAVNFVIEARTWILEEAWMVKEVNGIAGGIIGHKCFSTLSVDSRQLRYLCKWNSRPVSKANGTGHSSWMNHSTITHFNTKCVALILRNSI